MSVLQYYTVLYIHLFFFFLNVTRCAFLQGIVLLNFQIADDTLIYFLTSHIESSDEISTENEYLLLVYFT